MREANVEHLVVEIEDDVVSINTSREDLKSGGWDGRSTWSLFTRIDRLGDNTLRDMTANALLEKHEN
jgi:hypothetical protein